MDKLFTLIGVVVTATVVIFLAMITISGLMQIGEWITKWMK